MSIAVSLCFFMFFLVLGHSTLLHFLCEEAKGEPLSVKKIIFPAPRQGKAVSLLACFVALVFLLLAIFLAMASPVRPLTLEKILPVFTALVLLPAGGHGIYVVRRLRRAPGPLPDAKLVFMPSKATRLEFAAPILVAVTINSLGMLLR